jgi:hypothetical protein
MLEVALVGIPVIFSVISVFELARGMWNYQNIAYAVREGIRYATIHGRGCSSPNSCTVTIANITSVMRSAAVGIDPASVTLTFTPASGSATTGTMATLLTNTTTWPPSSANAPGLNVQISAAYSFRTFLAILWLRGRGQTFSLNASSTEPIQF